MYYSSKVMFIRMLMAGFFTIAPGNRQNKIKISIAKRVTQHKVRRKWGLCTPLPQLSELLLNPAQCPAINTPE